MALVDGEDQGVSHSTVAVMKEGKVLVRRSDVLRRTKPTNQCQLYVATAIARVNLIETVSAASNELEALTGKPTTTVARGQELTLIVAAANSEDVSTNVAREVVDEARKTRDELVRLATAGSRIGALINTTVGQTNLLALKATIEVMRAGEADRGFAVLAWKALAEQVAKAIGEISQQIAGINDVTNLSVDAVKAISGTIERMSESCSVIAYAAEEQSGATREIYRNICAYQNLVQEIRWQAGLPAFLPGLTGSLPEFR